MPTRQPKSLAHLAGRLLAVSLLAAGLAAALGCGGRGAGAGRRPAGTRVVLVTLDTLRYDAFAGSPERPSAMPLLQARAGRALAFERFYSATSSTQPTHATIFTSLPPWQHGVSRNGQHLADRLLTLAERFKAAGFATAATVASFPVSSRFGFAQGFDRMSEDFARGEMGDTWKEAGDAEGTYYSLAGHVADEAIQEIDQAQGEKQFFWFHFFDAHAPYGDAAGAAETLSPRQVIKAVVEDGADAAVEIERARRLYDADVSALDRGLDRVLSRLDRDAGRFETHVVVTADHGESFGEDGSMAHGKRLTPGEIHVLCLVFSPRVAAGARRDVAGSIDLAATLLSLAGVEQKLPNGRDLTAAPAQETRAFGMRRTFETPFKELRLDGTTVVHDFNLFYMVDPEGRLYVGNGGRLTAPDPPPAPAVVRQIEGRFAGFAKELATHAGDPGENDPEVEKGLKALGYTG